MRVIVTLLYLMLLALNSSLTPAQESLRRGDKKMPVDSAKNIGQYRSKGIDVYKSKEIQPYSSKQVETKKSHDIEVHKAKEIDVYKNKDIDSHKSKSIDTYRANTINPVSAGTIKSTTTNNESEKPNNNKTVVDKNKVEYLIDTWHTRIPGAVWQTPSGRDGYDNLHVSSGLKSGDLIIKANGTYIWNSYGGKKGNWVKGDSEYPIVLIDKSENKKWKVGYDSKHTGGRDIIIWDGNIWYEGKK